MRQVGSIGIGCQERVEFLGFCLRELLQYFTLDGLHILHYENLTESADIIGVVGDGRPDIMFIQLGIVNLKTGYNQIQSMSKVGKGRENKTQTLQ